MMQLLSSSLRSGLIALGLVSAMTATSVAGPITQPDVTIPKAAQLPITKVRDGWAGGNDRQFDNWQWRRNGSRNWDRGNWNRNWNRGNWNGRHGDWRWRRHYRGGGGYYDDGAAAILGLGLGLGLGSMYNSYDYYAPPPPPRRYYRTERLSSAHVRWCYDRYRSYRAWDNTFQPYNGPRQQCWSPYS